MLVFRMSIPHVRSSRIRWYARNFLPTCVPAAAPLEAPLTIQEDESQMQSDGPELLHPTEAIQADDFSASVDLREGDEKPNRNSGVVSGGIPETSVAKPSRAFGDARYKWPREVQDVYVILDLIMAKSKQTIADSDIQTKSCLSCGQRSTIAPTPFIIQDSAIRYCHPSRNPS